MTLVIKKYFHILIKLSLKKNFQQVQFSFAVFKNVLLDVENDLFFYPPPTIRSRKLLFYMSYATDIVPIMALVKGTCSINPPKQVKPASDKRSGATVVKCVLARARTCPVLSPAAQPIRVNLPSMFLLKYFVCLFKYHLS